MHRLAGRALSMAQEGYFLTGFYMKQALINDQALSFHHYYDRLPRPLRKLSDVWEKARAPMQNMVLNKWTDTVLKSNFAPRPVGGAFLKLAAPLAKMAPAILPRLLQPNVLTAAAVAGVVLLSPEVRQIVMDQVSQLAGAVRPQIDDVMSVDRSGPK